MRRVQGLPKDSSLKVGAKVTYHGHEMMVSKTPSRYGKIKEEIKMVDMSGVLALVASLPECKTLTILKCASHSTTKPHAVASAAYDALTFGLLLLSSLEFNVLGPEGCKAVAAVLDKTQITSLKCATAH